MERLWLCSSEREEEEEDEEEEMDTPSKILIFGATGYLGKYIVRASISMGHPTYVYSRPSVDARNPSKTELLEEFESMGVKVFQGYLDEHNKLVSLIRQVGIVISALPIPQHQDQLKIIEAIKEAGNIKRFVPSDWGCETDKATALPPFQAVLDGRKKIRRATESSGIPYTFVAANCFAAYFIDVLLQPHENKDHAIVYGTGEAKAVMTFEEDVAAYTIMAVNDPRTLNRTIIYMLPQNIVSQLELISLWEKKTGKTLKKTYISEEEAVALSKTLPRPENVKISILHNVFIEGDQVGFQLGDLLEASMLYPDYKYTSIDRLLDVCATDPPKIKPTAL